VGILALYQHCSLHNSQASNPVLMDGWIHTEATLYKINYIMQCVSLLYWRSDLWTLIAVCVEMLVRDLHLSVLMLYLFCNIEPFIKPEMFNYHGQTHSIYKICGFVMMEF
jgi:hypothetical protein